MDSAAFQASSPVGLRCFSIASGTAAYLTDGTNPLYIPIGVTLRLHARGELCAAYVQSVDDLTFDTTTCAITDVATTCGTGGASACPDGAGPGLSLGAGAVDYITTSGKSFTYGATPQTGVRIEPITRRNGVCETAGGVEAQPEIPCDESADCLGTYTVCDLTPDGVGTPPRRSGKTGGYIAAGAASATTLCVSWF